MIICMFLKFSHVFNENKYIVVAVYYCYCFPFKLWFIKKIYQQQQINTYEVHILYSFLYCITICSKVIMQGKLFQRCTHLLYCSVLSLGNNVNTRRMLQSDMRFIFHIKNQWNILVIGNYNVNYQKNFNLMLLTSSDTKRLQMHLFLFTNSA